ncbi:MAG: 5-formyltetrahydrofolate cyclo-ligase [Salinibacter sp.]
MPSSTASIPKDAWRSRFREYRQDLSPDSYRARSSLIGHRVLTVPEVGQAQVIHVYWPLPDRGEIDTRPLIGALREQGRDVVLPVVASFDPEAPTLEHRRYEGPETLQTNRWGIREPVDTDRVSPEALDVVLVPALGADRRGHRLGHGFGYYDAFLESVTCPRIALVYDACVVPELPNESHDVPMTTLVTERAVIDL